MREPVAEFATQKLDPALWANIERAVPIPRMPAKPRNGPSPFAAPSPPSRQPPPHPPEIRRDGLLRRLLSICLFLDDWATPSKGLRLNPTCCFNAKVWRGKPSPRAYFVGRYPFQRGHPATPRAQDARSFQDSPPAATAALPDSFLTLAAASSQLVTCEAPSFHCRSNVGGGMGCPPPTFHLEDILGNSAPCRSLTFLPALPWLPAVRPSRIV